MASPDDSIESLCERHDFPLANYREAEEGELLILQPASLTELPGAEQLDALGDELRDLGYNHVSFEVEDPE